MQAGVKGFLQMAVRKVHKPYYLIKCYSYGGRCFYLKSSHRDIVFLDKDKAERYAELVCNYEYEIEEIK